MKANNKQQPIKVTWNIHDVNQDQADKYSNGCLTVIDLSSILQQNDQMNMPHIKSQQSKKSINNNKGTKVQISIKKNQKLIKIMAMKQHRSQVRQISDTSKKSCVSSYDSIEIVSRVYDKMPNEFEKMCKYYALIKTEDSNTKYNDFSFLSSYTKNNAFSVKNEQNNQFSDKENQQFLKTEDYHLQAHFKNNEESDSSFSPNIRKQNINYPLKDQLLFRNQKYEDYENLMKNYQQERITSVNQKSKKVISQDSHKNNILNHSHYNNIQPLFNEKSASQITQSLKQQSKGRKILYDSSSSEEEVQDNIQKCRKILTDKVQEKILDSIHLCSNNQTQNRSCKLQPSSLLEICQEGINHGQNDCSSKNLISAIINNTSFLNHSHLKEEFNNFPVLSNVSNQQCFKNQLLKLDITDQEGVSKEKQDIVYQQLQLHLQNKARNDKNQKEDALSILQKCIYLTQASHVHSIMQNLLNNFESVSQMNVGTDEINSTEEDEEIAAAELKKKEVSSSRLLSRASTNFSRSSMTTQSQFNKTQTPPSISNIMENSSVCAIGFENIKVEISEVDNIQNCDQQQQIKDKQSQYQIEQQEYQSSTKLIFEKKENSKSFYEKSTERDQLCQSSSGKQQNYVSHCKKFFKLKNLTQTQQHQFRFSQYKKKNTSNLVSTYNSCSPKNASNSETTNQSSSNVSKFGKFHNYNKLFMYNVLNMFSPNNLANMNVPEVISKELQLLISRIKTSAKNNYKVEGKYAFDYFSHAHYNVLFLQLTPKNIENLSQQEEYVQLYQTCFNLNLTENISLITMTYINIMKLYCYQIFIECIKEEEIKVDNSLTQENLKNQYTLKVVRGIKKLSQGFIIKRF